MTRLRRILRTSAAILVALVALAIVLGGAGAFWFRAKLKASLPRLEGEMRLEGLAATVVVARDSLGVPLIRGENRLDTGRALGFVHAQDRFFQMDLLRRSAAGELSELIGGATLRRDREIRLHRFRNVARRVIEQATPFERALLDAYAAGVNAGLASLKAKPFEYYALSSAPAPWLPEDSILVLLAMFIELHDEDGSRESALGVLHDTLPAPLADFLAPRGTEWDAPIEGGPFTQPPVPGPEQFDLRGAPKTAGFPAATIATPAGGSPAESMPGAGSAEGSNNFALSGAHTASGSALLAGDMHLGISVPNTWYRASLLFRDGPGPEGERSLTGVTLPGAPVLVSGSNTHVAWAYTNAYGDWGDLVVLEPDPADPENGYLAPDGPRRFGLVPETILVRGGESVTVEVRETIWGPVLDRDHLGRNRAFRWTAHDPEAVNLGIVRLEGAKSLEEAFEAAHGSGIPPQNFVAADSSGRIGWTIMGAIPRREGFDGGLPGSWADGTRRWNGYLASSEIPAILDPPSGRLWTANARVVDGENLRKIGDGGYDLGARAGQLRDDIAGLEKATARDLLNVQLDDRAVFLGRWRELLLGLLTPPAVAADPRRAEFRNLIENWTGHAAVDDAGYRLVRAYRSFLYEHLFTPLTEACRKADSRFRFAEIPQEEGPLWTLVSERPAHLLDPNFGSWEDRLLRSVDMTIEYFTANGERLADRTWGQRNTIRFQHPLSLAVPLAGRWLDMPAEPLPGDSDMPRVQGPNFGASQRMVVSPGHEKEGIAHMPCGQSGHPLSPHYSDGHAAWARGDATPFLPGDPAHILTLHP